MQYFILICFTIIFNAFCATVGEFPFHELDASATDNFPLEHTTTDVSVITENGIIASETEFHDTTEEAVVGNQEPSPLLQVIRDFLFQARDSLLDPEGAILRSVAEGPIDEKTEKLIKVFENGIIEATTMLMSQVENAVVSTLPTATDPSVVQADFVKRVGDAFLIEPIEERIKENDIFIKNKRQMEQIANMSKSCSNCHTDLQSCVQQCFSMNNCNDIERNVRVCAPTPSRLCNPFTPWSPVDECQSNEECKSPLLCCNDGCINKCIPGVWRS